MNIALIVAAGSGKRMKGLDKPKQFTLVNGKPLLIFTLEAFDRNENVDSIVIVANTKYFSEIMEMCNKYKIKKIMYIVPGGKTRQDSVYNGLLGCGATANDIVLIHDAARPLISQKIINDNIEACKKYKAVETAIKVSDTIVKSADARTIKGLENREELLQVQTPQTFKYSLILKAHQNARKRMTTPSTDDATLAFQEGKKVHVVPGDKLNFKITTNDDLELFEAIVNKRED